MKPPADLPPLLRALGELFARRAQIPSEDFWAYCYRRKVPPPELRAAIVEECFPLVSPSDFLGLTSDTKNDTNDTMDARAISPSLTGRRPARGAHPLVAALRKKGVTFTELGTEIGRSRQSIRSWLVGKDDPTFRPIPEAIAKHLAKEYKVPMSTWPRLS